MAKKPLSEAFTAETYSLNLERYPQITADILGRKTGRPAKRLTFHQQGLKVESAEVSGKRKNISYRYETVRINHLKSRQEVRLHTKELLYPGQYNLKLVFYSRQPLESYRRLEKDENWRAYFPSIDEPESRDRAEFKLSYTDER